MASFPASKLEPEPPYSATWGAPASTRRAAFGISGLGSIRRPWTFPAKSASFQPRAGQSSGLLQGVNLCQFTKAFLTFSPLSSRQFACIYETKGEFSRDSFLNKENLFQGRFIISLSLEGGNSFWPSLICVSGWLFYNFLQFLHYQQYSFFVFGQN